MKYCIYCGQKLVDEARFCFKCGNKVIDEINQEEVDNQVNTDEEKTKQVDIKENKEAYRRYGK